TLSGTDQEKPSKTTPTRTGFSAPSGKSLSGSKTKPSTTYLTKEQKSLRLDHIRRELVLALTDTFRPFSVTFEDVVEKIFINCSSDLREPAKGGKGVRFSTKRLASLFGITAQSARRILERLVAKEFLRLGKLGKHEQGIL